MSRVEDHRHRSVDHDGSEIVQGEPVIGTQRRWREQAAAAGRRLRARLDRAGRAETLRYFVYIEVPAGAGVPRGSSFRFGVKGAVIPRTGDFLHFDTGVGNLDMEVREVAHWYSPPGEGPLYEIVVEAQVHDVCVDTARELLAPAALRGWIARFPYLEYTTDPCVPEPLSE
ncbi:hypothetical protein ACWDOP_00450 [Nocardia sp. NPDC003693]